MIYLQGSKLQVILTLGLISGFGQSRVIRSAVISIRENTYILAAVSIGEKKLTIYLRHILPNIFATIMVLFTVNMGNAIILEATISFLGFGVPPPIPSWGSMLNEAGTRYTAVAPWLAFWPGLALAIAVYGMNMLGDALRDLLDPRLRGGLGRYQGVKIKKIKRVDHPPT